MYKVFTCYSELQRMQRATRFSSSQIEHLSSKLLSEILGYSRWYSDYYAEQVADRKDPLGEPIATLKALPVMTKETLRAESSRIRSSKVRIGVKRNTSGGSTGEPAVFFQDARYRRWNRAAKLLFDTWSGVRLNHKKAILWAAQADVRAFSNWTGWLKAGLANELMLNAYRMSESSMSSYLDILQNERPEQFLVYAEGGHELARHALRHGRRLEGIRAVMSSAGTLFPDMRTTMEEAFGAPVFNRYGSREVGDVACECSSHFGLHVNPCTHYVEILREDGRDADPGELGRVIVTSLTNYAMPLIRYEVGDLACWSDRECPCGCKWPLLEKIEGRITDHLRLPDGTLVYGGALRRLLYKFPEIRKYQWVQESCDEVRLLVVLDQCTLADGEKWKKPVAGLDTEVKQVLGENCRLAVYVVDDIPASSSGKHRYVISTM